MSLQACTHSGKGKAALKLASVAVSVLVGKNTALNRKQKNRTDRKAF